MPDEFARAVQTYNYKNDERPPFLRAIVCTFLRILFGENITKASFILYGGAQTEADGVRNGCAAILDSRLTSSTCGKSRACVPAK